MRLTRNLQSPGRKETLPPFCKKVRWRRVLVEGSPHTKNPICALVFVGKFRMQPGSFQTRLARTLEGRGQQKIFPPRHTGVHRRRVLSGGGRTPCEKVHMCLALRSFISNAIWYVSNTTRYISDATGGTLDRPEPKETLPALSYGGTLQTCVGGRRGATSPPTKNSICALVSVVPF